MALILGKSTKRNDWIESNRIAIVVYTNRIEKDLQLKRYLISMGNEFAWMGIIPRNRESNDHLTDGACA